MNREDDSVTSHLFMIAVSHLCIVCGLCVAMCVTACWPFTLVSATVLASFRVRAVPHNLDVLLEQRPGHCPMQAVVDGATLRHLVTPTQCAERS